MQYLRELLGLSQKEFGEVTGISQSNISAMEKGTRDIGNSIDYRIISKVNVNPLWWFFGVEDPLRSSPNEELDPEAVQAMIHLCGISIKKAADIAELPLKTVSEFLNHHGEKSPAYVSTVLFYKLAYHLRFIINPTHFKKSDTPDTVEDLPTIEELQDVGQSKRSNHFLELSDGTLIVSIPLVEAPDLAGYPSEWNDAEYLNTLPRHSIVVDKNDIGVYRAFRVRGESMNDGTSRSIMPGDIVTGRRIEKHLWTSKLHLRKFKFYLIVQEDGIMVKVIVNHDVENGILHCRSLNPDGDLYPDFHLSLDTVIELYNIVSLERKLEF